MPAPSPMTKPSRSAEKGRLAVSGESLRLERAVSRLKPVTPKGWIIVCAPPESITSASPRASTAQASPMACVLAAQAVRQLLAGPIAPNSSARCVSGMLGSCSTSRSASNCRCASSAHRFASTAPASASHAASVVAT